MTARFASITSGLLVRKGDASPSIEARSLQPPPPHRLDATPDLRPPLTQAPTEPAVLARCARGDGGTSSDPAGGAPAACRLPDSERGLRASVRLGPDEARRLRLAAVLLDRSHQDLLAAALDLYLDRVARRELKDCACFRAMGAPPGS